MVRVLQPPGLARVHNQESQSGGRAWAKAASPARTAFSIAAAFPCPAWFLSFLRSGLCCAHPCSVLSAARPGVPPSFNNFARPPALTTYPVNPPSTTTTILDLPLSTSDYTSSTIPPRHVSTPQPLLSLFSLLLFCLALSHTRLLLLLFHRPTAFIVSCSSSDAHTNRTSTVALDSFHLRKLLGLPPLIPRPRSSKARPCSTKPVVLSRRRQLRTFWSFRRSGPRTLLPPRPLTLCRVTCS